MTNICILGYAPSMSLAPINDPIWDIWTMNHRIELLPSKIDLHFELHATNPYFEKYHWEYFQFLKEKHEKAIVTGIDPRLNEATIYPLQEMISKYGMIFTSTVALMLAFAIEKNPKKIGLWGIELSSKIEYKEQLSNVLYLIQKAREKGIEVYFPPSSKLLNNPVPVNIDNTCLYGSWPEEIYANYEGVKRICLG